MTLKIVDKADLVPGREYVVRLGGPWVYGVLYCGPAGVGGGRLFERPGTAAWVGAYVDQALPLLSALTTWEFAEVVE